MLKTPEPTMFAPDSASGGGVAQTIDPAIIAPIPMHPLASQDVGNESLGRLRSGGPDEPESAVARLERGCSLRRQEAERCKTTGAPYPFYLDRVFYEGINILMEEAFYPKLTSMDEDMQRQASQAARECVDELLGGTRMLRMSPEKMMKLETDIATLTREITKEAVALVKTPCAPGKPTGQSIGAELKNRINTSKSAQDFKFNYLGFVAKLEDEERDGHGHSKAKPH